MNNLDLFCQCNAMNDDGEEEEKLQWGDCCKFVTLKIMVIELNVWLHFLFLFFTCSVIAFQIPWNGMENQKRSTTAVAAALLHFWWMYQCARHYVLECSQMFNKFNRFYYTHARTHTSHVSIFVGHFGHSNKTFRSISFEGYLNGSHDFFEMVRVVFCWFFFYSLHFWFLVQNDESYISRSALALTLVWLFVYLVFTFCRVQASEWVCSECVSKVFCLYLALSWAHKPSFVCSIRNSSTDK